MPEPEPEIITLCSACRLPWDDHESLAEQRRDEEHEYSIADNLPPPVVTHEECVTLLRRERLGPVGPPGATGPMGMAVPLSSRHP